MQSDQLKRLLISKATYSPRTERQLALQAQINTLCRTRRIDVPELLISQTFPELPAVSYRDSKRRCVILHESLFDLLTDSELLATALHELGHISKSLTENSDDRTEISCDVFAIKMLQEKESMISSIKKMQTIAGSSDSTLCRLEVLAELNVSELLAANKTVAR